MAYSQRLTRKAIAWLIGAVFLLPLTTSAEVPMPVIPKAKGQECVEPTDVMRKDHMKFMLHQRDETMQRGIRTTKHSLKECIECHNAPDENGKVANVDTPDHFCSSCHTYSAVKIDCFECHADKPENTQYLHSIVDGKTPHHANMKSEDKTLSKETLEMLAAKGKQ